METPESIRISLNTGKYVFIRPPGPVFTNILILRKRIFLRIRKFSYLRIFLFLEKNCIHKAILKNYF